MAFSRFWLPTLCFAGLSLWAFSPIRLDDLFLYLTFGRRFFELGEFGPTDTLIFTIKDHQWELWHEWLSYIVYYSTYWLGGYEGLIVLRALLVVLAGAILWRTCARGRLAPLPSVLILGAAFVAASPRCFRDRSSFFTDLLIAGVLFVLVDPLLKWRRFLPALFLLWVQLHSGYIIGWFLIGLFVLSQWRKWDGPARREWVLIFISCILVTLINPKFLDGALWPLRAFLLSDRGILGQIVEFAPTLPAEFLSWPYKVFLVLYMLMVVLITGASIPRQGWFHFAASLTLTYLGLKYSRMVNLAGLGLGVLLASSLVHMEAMKWRARWSEALAYGLALLVIVLSFTSEQHGLRFLAAGQPLQNTIPEKAVQFLMTLPPGHTFNEWQLGSYLAWALDGRQKIAAHGFVSDPKLVEQYIYRFSVSREGWNEIILGGNVQYFFLRRQTFEESKSAAWIKELAGPDWQNIYKDGAAVIFRRVHSRGSPSFSK